jgi:predicted nucleic acid-binding protein
VKIVPDANIVVALVISLPYSEAAIRKMQQWLQEEAELVAPALWSYEVASILRKTVALRGLSPEMAAANLQDILSMEIRQVPPTPALHLKALDWAARLNQTVAYDAAYLALAESEGAEFWTADRRLADSASQAGVLWVHYISEVSA